MKLSHCVEVYPDVVKHSCGKKTQNTVFFFSQKIKTLYCSRPFYNLLQFSYHVHLL